MEFPNILNKIVKVNIAEFNLEISPLLEAFRGHFDSAPIVPGVEQINWVLHFAQQSFEFDKEIAVSRIDALKFQNVIQPNSQVSLKLVKLENRIEFAFTSDELRHSSGKILIE